MVQARGVVMPVADSCAHLCVRLENGEVIVGQHRFTGKTATSITSPILDMWLSASLDDPSPVSVPIQPRLAHVIRTADLICYPVGSFFSSVMANLLPLGVSCAVREAACRRCSFPISARTRSFSGSRCRIRWRICCVSEPTAAGGADAQLASCGRGRVPLSRRHPLRVACPARHPCPQGASCFRASLSRRGLAVPRALGDWK